jgi:ribosomal-protein-alanine N-acetyltransferase
MPDLIKSPLPVEITWLNKTRYLDQIVSIENACFPDPWSMKEWEKTLEDPNAKALVALNRDPQRKNPEQEEVLGFSLYYEHNRELILVDKNTGREYAYEFPIEIWNLAVKPEFRRNKIGSVLLARTKNALSVKRNPLLAIVRETNLLAQLFFRSQKLRAKGVLNDFYPDAPNEDAYLMEYTLDQNRDLQQSQEQSSYFALYRS